MISSEMLLTQCIDRNKQWSKLHLKMINEIENLRNCLKNNELKMDLMLCRSEVIKLYIKHFTFFPFVISYFVFESNRICVKTKGNGKDVNGFNSKANKPNRSNCHFIW